MVLKQTKCILHYALKLNKALETRTTFYCSPGKEDGLTYCPSCDIGIKLNLHITMMLQIIYIPSTLPARWLSHCLIVFYLYTFRFGTTSIQGSAFEKAWNYIRTCECISGNSKIVFTIYKCFLFFLFTTHCSISK